MRIPKKGGYDEHEQQAGSLKLNNGERHENGLTGKNFTKPCRSIYRDDLPEPIEKVINIKGFGDIIGGALLFGLYCHLQRVIGGE